MLPAIHKREFLGEEVRAVSPELARFFIIPVPYGRGVSYGKGADRGPEAVIRASEYLELYDEVYESEPWKAGIRTLKPLRSRNPEKLKTGIRDTVNRLLKLDRVPVGLGGDHSISAGFCSGMLEHFGRISVIQIDAHADLRESYEGSIHSHASVMSRIRQITANTLQIGIRSLSAGEAERIRDENIPVIFMHEYRNRPEVVLKEVRQLPDPVFLTLDVDALDWSVIRSTGTPEPGGFTWDEIVLLLEQIFKERIVAGFDVVELSGGKGEINSAFAAAKLIYKMIALSELNCQKDPGA